MTELKIRFLCRIMKKMLLIVVYYLAISLICSAAWGHLCLIFPTQRGPMDITKVNDNIFVAVIVLFCLNPYDLSMHIVFDCICSFMLLIISKARAVLRIQRTRNVITNVGFIYILRK